jgi:hypothetical protein
LAETPREIKSLVQPKSRTTLGFAVVKSMQVKRRVTRTLFFIGYRFNGIDSKIVHIFTMFLTIAAVLTKTAFEPRRFLDPRLEAPPLEVKIPTA